MNISTKYLKFYALFFLSALYFTPVYSQSGQPGSGRTEIRYVASNNLNVFAEPSSSSKLVGTLYHLDKIIVETLGAEMTVEVRERIRREKGIWVKIISPLKGYIFQKRLIKFKGKRITKKNNEEIPTSSFLNKILGRESTIGKETKENEREKEDYVLDQMDSSNGIIWINFGLGFLVFPEESGYSASIMDTMDFSVDYNYKPIPLLKFRGGVNMSKSTGGSYGTSTNSLYGAIRFPFSVKRPPFLPEFINDLELIGLAGLAYMMTDLTSGGSGSSSSIGFLGGVSANLKLKEDWRVGAQFMLISGQTRLGAVSKYVGSNQLRVTLGKLF